MRCNRGLRWAIAVLLVPLLFLTNCGKEGKEGVKQKEPAKADAADVSKDYIVKILPESPTAADSILAEVKTGGEREGLSSKLNFTWEKNNQEIKEFKSQRIEGSNFKKGDIIRVRIIPEGGGAKGAVFYSDTVIIQNALPVVANIKIKPDKSVSKKDTLTASAEAKDPDGDAVSLKYQWLRNGTEEIEGANSNILSPAHFKHGDFISVRVTANDGIADGKPVASGPIAIANSPPEIASQPPTEVKGFNYIYKVSAVDLDKDNLSYSLSNAPAGMTISASGEIKWNITERDEGKHDVEIVVEDGNGGRTVQGYLLTIKLPR